MRNAFREFIGRARRNTSGASAIEFTIVAPVFFLLIFGIIIYGYYFATMSLMNHIAYEAARATISGLYDDERSTLAHARADALIASLSSFVGSDTIEVDAAPASDGIFTVTVHYQFNWVNLIGASSLLPLPSSDQTVTVQISHGGY